jgi:hypothetical protein
MFAFALPLGRVAALQWPQLVQRYLVHRWNVSCRNMVILLHARLSTSNRRSPVPVYERLRWRHRPATLQEPQIHSHRHTPDGNSISHSAIRWTVRTRTMTVWPSHPSRQTCKKSHIHLHTWNRVRTLRLHLDEIVVCSVLGIVKSSATLRTICWLKSRYATRASLQAESNRHNLWTWYPSSQRQRMHEIYCQADAGPSYSSRIRNDVNLLSAGQ